MPRSIIILAALLLPATAMAQSEDVFQPLSFEGKTWSASIDGSDVPADAGPDARIEPYLGRNALILSSGRLWLEGTELSNGVIEFDVAIDEGFGFIGPMWRAERRDRFEEIYFRTHLSGKPDAVQYTPVENGLSAWQIFSDENSVAAIDLDYDGWNHLKVVVEGDAADLYFNSDTPVLHIPDLKTDIGAGAVGLRVGGRGAARFSNIEVRPLRASEGVIGAPKETPALPEGLISSWEVSSPFAEEHVETALSLSNDHTDDLTWDTLDTETNGIANLAKLSGKRSTADTVFVRFNIDSERAQMKELRFGYSDRVRIYVNGKRVYYGNAQWRLRDYRFLGTVGFFDSVGLDLKRGDNEVIIAVSETFGGWAWAGAMADQSGAEIKG